MRTIITLCAIVGMLVAVPAAQAHHLKNHRSHRSAETVEDELILRGGTAAIGTTVALILNDAASNRHQEEQEQDVQHVRLLMQDQANIQERQAEMKYRFIEDSAFRRAALSGNNSESAQAYDRMRASEFSEETSEAQQIDFAERDRRRREAARQARQNRQTAPQVGQQQGRRLQPAQTRMRMSPEEARRYRSSQQYAEDLALQLLELSQTSGRLINALGGMGFARHHPELQGLYAEFSGVMKSLSPRNVTRQDIPRLKEGIRIAQRIEQILWEEAEREGLVQIETQVQEQEQPDSQRRSDGRGSSQMDREGNRTPRDTAQDEQQTEESEESADENPQVIVE